MPDLPNLTGLNDSGPSNDEAPRAIIGSVLIPCIFVDDVIALEQKIKNSPYYILHYKQYWYRLWSDILQSGSARVFTETTGIPPVSQTQMRNTIDMSIGAEMNMKL